jgi:hypothetical protein
MFRIPTDGVQGDTAQHALSEQQQQRSGGADQPLLPRGGVYLLPSLYGPLVQLESAGSAGGTAPLVCVDVCAALHTTLLVSAWMGPSTC